MKRWCVAERKVVESQNADEFLFDIEEVCRRHNISIVYELRHGFELIPFSEDRMRELKQAVFLTEVV